MNSLDGDYALSHQWPAGPQTRISLLLRIQSTENDESWRLFVQVYGPTIYHYCRRRGLQDADAADVMQESLLQVSKSIARFDYQPDRGRFRSWLKAVVHSKLCRFFAKRSATLESLDPQLESQCDTHGIDHGQWQDLVHQELIVQALEVVKQHCEAESWTAFEMLWKDGRSAPEVAQQMGKPVQWVYVVKSRMGARLQTAVRELARDVA